MLSLKPSLLESPERSHLQEVLGAVAHICNNVCKFGHMLLLQTFKALEHDGGHSS